MKKLLALVFLATVLVSCMHEVTVRGVVVSHEVVADKMGQRTYCTIIKTEDGYVEEKTGLVYYAEPIGSHVTVTVYRSNK
jgi:hypothetical protein